VRVTTWWSGSDAPAAGRQRGFGAEPPTMRRFIQLLSKNKAF